MGTMATTDTTAGLHWTVEQWHPGYLPWADRALVLCEPAVALDCLAEDLTWYVDLMHGDAADLLWREGEDAQEEASALLREAARVGLIVLWLEGAAALVDEGRPLGAVALPDPSGDGSEPGPSVRDALTRGYVVDVDTGMGPTTRVGLLPHDRGTVDAWTVADPDGDWLEHADDCPMAHGA